MNSREQFIKDVSNGKVADEAVIEYCNNVVQSELDLQGLILDFEKASRNSAYMQQGYINNAIGAICRYLGVSSVWEVKEVNLKAIYEEALKRSGYSDEEKKQQALLHQQLEQPEPQLQRKPSNADEVLKKFGLVMRFEVIALNKTQTACVLDALLDEACTIPVADGVEIAKKALAKRITESLVDWLVTDGNRNLYKYCLKKSSFKNIAPDAERLANAIQDRAKEWFESVVDVEVPTNSIPEEMQSDEAQELLQKAINSGLVVLNKGQYEWKGSKQLLAYFAFKASDYLELTTQQDQKGNFVTCWKPFEVLFCVKDLRNAKANWMRLNTKFEPTGYEQIDMLFAN